MRNHRKGELVQNTLNNMRLRKIESIKDKIVASLRMRNY